MKVQREKFDFAADPVKTKWYLKPVTKLLSFPDMVVHHPVIHCRGTADLKPPYLLLCNHNAFMDFKVATQVIFPHNANYVVAIDGFIGREKLLRDVGCIGKRKFTTDLNLVRNLKKAADNGSILVVYPEARYSLCGTTAVLPESLGKLCKFLDIPVVTLICHGHHINAPFWNTKDRGIPVEAHYTLQFTRRGLAKRTPEQINKTLVKAFQYDDYRWQAQNGIDVNSPKRAEGLHKVLYQCPHCKTEYRMSSRGAILSCNACGKSWQMTKRGELQAMHNTTTEFTHIPDWYEWQRANVRKEVEEGRYTTGELPVHIDSLPNAKGFFRLGNGTFVHDMTGFHVKGIDVDGDPFSMEIPVPSAYSVHIEYNYLGKHGDCVDLNTKDETWYTYPEVENVSVTKIALATEELYFHYRRSIGKPCPPGLA